MGGRQGGRQEGRVEGRVKGGGGKKEVGAKQGIGEDGEWGREWGRKGAERAAGF